MKLALILAALLPAAALALEEDAPRTAFTFRVRKSTATVQVLMGGQSHVAQLRITFSSPHIPAQVIPCSDADIIRNALEQNTPGFSSADYNDDGYTDFRFVDLSGRDAVHTGCYFFYNPSKHRFERRSDFDAAGVLDYDPTTRLFSCSGREGSVFYRFEHGQYRLVRRIQKGFADAFRDILPHAPDDREYLITTLYLPNGRMRRFYSHIGPPR
ncbi:XAC2610-related protein [Prosthecobacter sp.]|uniref:XAC2610-related protein n=1 Tax=Prosthecobacter sp. TaxID=1965333 RepID=UPI0037831E40